MPSVFSIFEKRANLENPSTSLANPAAWAVELFSSKSDSGVSVSEKTSLMHSAVWNAVQIIATTCASLSIDIFEVNSDGNKISKKTLPAYRLLNRSTRFEGGISSFIHRQTALTWALLWGNYLAEIERDLRGAPIALNILDSSQYKGETKAGKKIIYDLRTNKPINLANVLHVPNITLDGVWGISTIAHARNSIGLGLATEKFGNKFFANGAHLGAYIEYPGMFSSAAKKEEFQQKFNEKYGGLNKDMTRGTVVLDQGMKLHQLGIPPEDAQFLQTRKETVADIARWFNTPLHKLKNLDRSTNNNIEHQGIEFVTDTINPWNIKFEQEFEDKLLTEDQKRSGRFQIRHNTAGLLRGDIKTQTEHIRAMIEKGVYSPNMALRFLGQNTIPDGDRHFIQQQLMPLDKVDEVLANQGSNFNKETQNEDGET